VEAAAATADMATAATAATATEGEACARHGHRQHNGKRCRGREKG
jgi:hypothetical protein